MKNWKILTPIVAIALFVAWYAFRPEWLIVERRVNETTPAPSLPRSRLLQDQTPAVHLSFIDFSAKRTERANYRGVECAFGTFHTEIIIITGTIGRSLR
jgi:hypothetical protein